MEFLIFLALGLFVGGFGTLVGIGGGLFLIPFFMYFMSEGCVYPYFHSAPEIVGTSLFVIFLNALSGTIAYIRQKKVFYKAGIPFALATLPGAYMGSYIADKFTGPALSISFGCFLLLVASIMLWNTLKKKRVDPEFDPLTFRFNMAIGIMSSLGVGFISSIFGVGGGIIHVPMMIYVLDFPTHLATATSHFILMISTSMGVVSHWLLENVVLLPAVCIGVGATVGAQIGAIISNRTKSRTIILLLSIVVYILGAKMIFSAL